MKDRPHVYVVEASAGSGKTYALVEHYTNLLLAENSNPKQIENILAITFTNKAASEMKERILESLRKTALDNSSNLQNKAQKLIDYIIANYDFFQIQTIDSFINKILTSCAFRLDISPNFEIKDDHRRLLSESLDKCIDSANHNKSVEELFKNFLRQYLYLESKTGWMPKKDILNLIDSMFYMKNIYGKNFRRFDLKGENILISKRRLLKDYQSINEKISSDINGTFRNALNRFVKNNKDNFDFSDIAKKSFLKDELPALKNKTVSKELNNLWKEIRNKSRELSEKEAASFFNCYIDIFVLVYQTFRTNARKMDVLFLTELNELAHSLIRENEVDVPELYYRLATRIRHFLIDEFQDTSVLQWQNLEPMIEEILSTGGSFFCVGDKKQAIFRFRGGETALLDEIKNRFPEYIEETFLNTNYRSQKEIVEFVNSVFEKENLRRFINQQQDFSENDIEEIISVFLYAKQEHRKDKSAQSGFVKIETVEIIDKEEKYEIIKEKLLNLVEQLKTQNSSGPRDIALLCRENQDVELVSGWLLDKNIPVESEKTLNIKNNPFIVELISFLKFLNSPRDNLAFASFIMGEIWTKASGTDKTEIQNFLFDIRGKDVCICREFQNAHPKIWDSKIGDFFKTVGFMELYEFVVDVYKKFDVLKNFPQQQAFFMHFIEIIKNNEQEYNGITDFPDYFKELSGKDIFVNTNDMDAIKVLTIHKAKGLGFGTVIIPFLELDINSSRQNRNLHANLMDRNSENLSLVRLDRKYAQLSNRVAYLLKEEYKRSFIDELNTLYVAMTRAENELYIFIPFSETGNIAKHLIPINPED